METEKLEIVRVEMAKLVAHYKREAGRYAEVGNYHNAMVMQSQAEGYGMACMFLAEQTGVPKKLATRAVVMQRQNTLCSIHMSHMCDCERTGLQA